MTQPFDRLNGLMMVKEIRQGTYSMRLSVHVGSYGQPRTIVGLHNVDVVLRAIGVADEVRARVIDDVKARRAGSTGRIRFSRDDLRRLGLL